MTYLGQTVGLTKFIDAIANESGPIIDPRTGVPYPIRKVGGEYVIEKPYAGQDESILPVSETPTAVRQATPRSYSSH